MLDKKSGTLGAAFFIYDLRFWKCDLMLDYELTSCGFFLAFYFIEINPIAKFADVNGGFG